MTLLMHHAANRDDLHGWPSPLLLAARSDGPMPFITTSTRFGRCHSAQPRNQPN
jgi:hypothetical protein